MSDPTLPPPRRPRARRFVSLLAAALVTAGASAAAAHPPSAAAHPARPAAQKAAAPLPPVVRVGSWRSTGPSGEQSARAQCPAGYYATGGGAETDGGAGTNGGVPHLSTSIAVPQQTDTADGWAVTARNYSTQVGMSIRAYVICDQAAHSVRETTTFDVPFGATGSAIADCPAGTTASGGGYSAFGAGPGDQSVFLIHDSAPAGADGWRVEGSNSALDPGFITAQVICSTQPHVVRLAPATRTPHNSVGQSTVSCLSPNEAPTGGGQFVGTRVYPLESYPTLGGWTVAARNTSGEEQHIVAVAICRPLA